MQKLAIIVTVAFFALCLCLPFRSAADIYRAKSDGPHPQSPRLVVQGDRITEVRPGEGTQIEFVPGEVLVKFADPSFATRLLQSQKTSKGILRISTSANLTNVFQKFEIKQAATPFAFAAASPLKNVVKLMSPSLKDNREKTRELMLELKGKPEVEYAELNFILRTQAVPNDPYYSSSGAWGQTFRDLWGLQNISAETAWNSSTGQNVVVAVSDSGVDYNHEDIADNIWQNSGETGTDSTGHDKKSNGIDDDGNGVIDDWHGYNFVARNDSSPNNDPMDDFGHGTHVAGTIAAVANNGKGIVGVAFGAKIMPVKGLDKNGLGTTDDLAKTILYAADNGAKVINASWGGLANAPIQTLVNAIAYAHDTKGVVFVASAGNSNADVGTPQSGFVPANIRNVITVSAFDHLDAKASFSNFGQKIDVAAPGGGDSGPGSIYAPNRSILSLLSSAAQPAMTDLGQLVIGDKYLRQAGTSMASPHVAGVAALIRSLHPEFGPEQVRQAIRFGADDVDAVGFDTNSGYGRINAAKSLTVSMPLVAQLTGPLMPITDTCSVPIDGSVGGTGLSTWRLEFGVGTNPVSWTQITSSGTPISNAQLANWNISNLAEGTYTVRLIAQNTSGQLFEDRLPITIDNVFIASPAVDAFFNPGALVTIKGTVTGCTFVSYTIKIKRVSDGQFLTNPSVTITNGGLQRVRNDVLGAWDTTNVPDDRYDIVVEMQQVNGSVQKSVRVLITARVSLLKSFHESSVTNPVTSDLDGDGTDEIIFATTDSSFTIGGKIHILRQDGTELPGWPVALTNTPLNNTPAIGDVNNDGIPEIVVESFARRGLGSFQHVYAFNLQGNLLNGFPLALGFGGFFTNGQTPSPALTDVDLDGKLDIIAVSAGFGLGASRRVVAIDGNAKIIFDAALPDAPSGQLEWMSGSIPMIGNIVGDEAPEIIIGVFNIDSAFAKYYALNNKGQILSGWPIQFGPPSGSIMQYGALADIDGDGYDEIALMENRNVENPVLHVLRGNGVEVSGFPQTLPASGGLSKFLINPSFADLDGDGLPEVVTAIGDQLSNSVVAYNRFGTQIMNSSFSGGVLQTQGAVSVASNDADGKSLIVFPYYENGLATQLILQGMKSDGTRPTGFPIYIPKLCQDPFCQAATSVALLRNIQSTSTKGVIVDASANVFVVDLGVNACGLSGPWPQLQHDARRTGKYKLPIRSFVISSSNAFHPSSGGDGTINVIAPNGCDWTASSSASWITIKSGAAGAGSGSVTYQVAANAGSERSAAITVAGQTFTVKQAGVPIEVTLQTNPAGRAFTVDGTTYISSQTFSWTSGASHAITVPSPQLGGTNTQWVWSSWSDGGMLEHTVAPTSNTTYIANFITTPCAPLPSGLMAWWRGDGNAQDETGVNHGTLIGNMTFGGGKVGGGFLGNSSNNAGLVQVPDSPSLALNRSMTLEGWLKVNSYGGTVIERRTSDFHWSYQLWILPSGQLLFTIWYDNNSGTSVDSDPLPLGQFLHFAASLDDNTSQAKLYINGNPVRQVTITQRPNVISDAMINIGNINGITDELSVYDRALSSSEIQDIYNAGVTGMVGKCPAALVGLSIFTEQVATNRALALDSVTRVLGPFRVLTDHNFSADGHTRVILFTSDLGMTQPDSTQLSVRAGGVPLTVENVGPVVGVSGMNASYIIVRLPDGLPAGDLPLAITLRGFTSANSPTLSIAP